MRTPPGVVQPRSVVFIRSLNFERLKFLPSRLGQSACAPPRIVFSAPLDDSVETRPDCYHIYKSWCPEAEAELEDVLGSRLGLGPTATTKIIKYAKHYEANIYKNPARVLCRVESWVPLEGEFPGTDVRRLLTLNPQLITYKASTLRRKLRHLTHIFQLNDDTSKLARYTTRCSALLTRSNESISQHVQSLQSFLGADLAPAVVARYPELLSRDASGMAAAFSELTAALGGNVHTAKRMVNSNPALLKQRRLQERLERLAATVSISAEDVRLCSLPCTACLLSRC